MANPQTENGFFKMSNELWEALVRTRIPGEARQVLDFIVRRTYGFHETSAKISLDEFVEATGLAKSNVCRGILRLAKMRLIIKTDNGSGARFRIQKNYDRWLSKTITLSKPIIPVVKNDNAVKIKDRSKDKLLEGAEVTAQAVKFVTIASKYVDKFAVRPLEDAQWFDRTITFGKYSKGLDIEDVLEGWETWMDEQLRRKQAGRPNKFPKADYRGSFRNRCKIEQQRPATRIGADGKKRPWDLGNFDKPQT